jgi:hypothetical protein
MPVTLSAICVLTLPEDKEKTMARCIPVNGDEFPVQPAQGERFQIQELENLIGDQVDTLPLEGGNVMFFARTGRILNLPVNRTASMIVQTDPVGKVNLDQPIVGPVVIISQDEFPALTSTLQAYYG